MARTLDFQSIQWSRTGGFECRSEGSSGVSLPLVAHCAFDFYGGENCRFNKMLVRKKLSRRNENESADLIKLSKKRSGKAAGFTVAYVEWIMQESSNCLWVERRGTTRVSQRRVDNKDNNDFEKHQSVLFSPLEHLTLIKKIGHIDDTIWVAALFKKSQCTTEQYFRTRVTVKKDTVDSTCVASVTLTYSVLVACFFYVLTVTVSSAGLYYPDNVCLHPPAWCWAVGTTRCYEKKY